MKYCLDCNGDISDRHKSAKFCIDCLIIRKKKYAQSIRGRAVSARYCRKYSKTEAGRAASARSSRKYNKTEKGIKTRRKYLQSPNGKKVTSLYRLNYSQKDSCNAKEKK